MNALTPFSLTSARTLVRKDGAVNVLERLCEVIEPTQTQKETAQDRYQAVGAWLSEAPSDIFQNVRISPQGSFALGTAIKPLSGYEYDVDLLCRFTALAGTRGPDELKRILGDRLRENWIYGRMLEDMPRCWRLDYAGEFHMDITPSIPNARCLNGGELVPDRNLRTWKATNPSGYLKLFERRAARTPVIRMAKSFVAMDSMAQVDPFPQHRGFKGLLRRIVQLLKRHRDIYFQNDEESLGPISVILTTLASQAYEFCVDKHVFGSEFDVVVAVVQAMPWFIDDTPVYGQPHWLIANETTEGENFAEKWNAYPERAAAFYEWHARMLADVQQLAELEGSDRITRRLEQSFGNQPVRQVVEAMAEEVNVRRRDKTLAVAPVFGIVTDTEVPKATPVRQNTFYGRR